MSTPTPNDGGPAFPRPASEANYHGCQDGMTKREWLAGQALAGILSVYGRVLDEDTAAELAIEARWCADAMLAELKGPQ